MLRKFIPSTHKLTTNVFFLFEKRSLLFLPPILKFMARSFQNSFSFWSSSYQKSGADLKKILDTFLLHWCDYTQMVGFLPGLQHVCSLPAAIPGCLKFIYRL